MGIDDEFASDALVEFGVTLGRGIQGDHGCVDRFGDLDAVVQNRHHQAAVVFQYRGLAGEERVRLCPPETEAKAEVAFSRGLLLRARIRRDVQTWDTDSPRRARRFHKLIEDRGRLLLPASLLGFEADAIDGAIHLGHLEYLLDALADRSSLRQI